MKDAPPVLPRVVAEGATPEALVQVAAGQQGSIAVMSSEGKILREVLGLRYSKDKSTNMTLLLKGYSGEDHHLDRVGRVGGNLRRHGTATPRALRTARLPTLPRHHDVGP